MDLMWYLVLAHLIGDYALQSDRMAERKGQSKTVLTVHVLIYAAVIGVTLWVYGATTGHYTFWRWPTGGLLAPLFALHWFQDYLKGRYFRSRQAYYQDQALHIIQLFVIRWLLV